MVSSKIFWKNKHSQVKPILYQLLLCVMLIQWAHLNGITGNVIDQMLLSVLALLASSVS
jgi:hypothetical protein